MWETQGQRVRRKERQGIWARMGKGGKWKAKEMEIKLNLKKKR